MVSRLSLGRDQKVNDYFSLKQQNEKLALENGRLTSEVRSLRMALNEADSTSSRTERKWIHVCSCHDSEIQQESQHNYLILAKARLTDKQILGSSRLTG
jgi:hypothetical protein